VQDWVQLEKEKWLPNSCKRHQIGHLDFGFPRLLTEVASSNLARGANFLAYFVFNNFRRYPFAGFELKPPARKPTLKGFHF